jgi:hypothetical protein
MQESTPRNVVLHPIRTRQQTESAVSRLHGAQHPMVVHLRRVHVRAGGAALTRRVRCAVARTAVDLLPAGTWAVDRGGRRRLRPARALPFIINQSATVGSRI